MDAVEEEQDVQLQKHASNLLADFDASLKPFLWRAAGPGRLRIRRRVRARERDRLLRLLEPFQDLPQLLDHHLGNFLPPLADAYLESLRTASASKRPAGTIAQLIPLPTAICQLLYTFCKIRGEKVVVRFLSTETKNLELLLFAVEAAGTPVSDGSTEPISPDATAWTWEERYVSLLWLSHLLLAPFDLASISSAGTADYNRPEIPGLRWPENLPGVTTRVVPLAVRYLASAGKEREAAKVLLIRISMRRDMQELGLLHALLHWALSYLCSAAPAEANSTYYSIGILSYLSGLLVSSTGTSNMDPFISKIFLAVQAMIDQKVATREIIQSSALARKTLIKVLRTLTVLVLQGNQLSPMHGVEATNVVETAIGHFLEALADNDTPVRLAASKALSVITLKLAPAMAAQVVEAVLDSLNRNVLWTDRKDQSKTRDISAVNPLEWHGLMLTLAHLLYRRSPPAESLSDILHALLLGLSFERRSTSGSSIGSNVRDAACFGIWALARRYSTAELHSVITSSVFAAKQHESSSILQVLATELVVTASLDPAGNIRRGASAALQELIGRHPDTVAEGIAVVQVVDYHAVALRSRAMLEVAPKVALLSSYYEDALLDGLFDWRGVGDGDAVSRRNAARAVGLLAKGFQLNIEEPPWDKIGNLIQSMERRLNDLKAREMDQRHGLLLSIAAVTSSLSLFLSKKNISIAVSRHSGMRATIEKVFRALNSILVTEKSSDYRRAELAAEGVSRIILAVVPVLRTDMILRADDISSLPQYLKIQDINQLQLPNLSNPILGSAKSAKEVDLFMHELGVCHEYGIQGHADIVKKSEGLLAIWLRRKEQEVVAVATEAAVGLLLIVDSEQRQVLIEKWIGEVAENRRGRLPVGYMNTLSIGFSIIQESQQVKICELVIDRWQVTSSIKDKIAILRGLTEGLMLELNPSTFIAMIAGGLDDYTTDGRGDIGSLIRVEALKAAGIVFSSIPWTKIKEVNDVAQPWYRKPDEFSILYGKVLRLSAEKLDRVRAVAQKTLSHVCCDDIERQRFELLSISSLEYFRWLLDLQTHDWLKLRLFEYEPSDWRLDLFEGLVSSAGTGSEDLIRACRAALLDFCESGQSKDEILPGKVNSCHFVCESLLEVAKKNFDNDRVLVPTLEVMGFLFDAGIMQQSFLSWRSLFLMVQKAHYKTGNVRKLEAAIKLYGGIVQVYPEALDKLTSMLLHPFPKMRNQVADVLFIARGVGKGVDWTKAGKGDLIKLRAELAAPNEGK